MHTQNYNALERDLQGQMESVLGKGRVSVVDGHPSLVVDTAICLAEAKILYHRPPCFVFTVFKDSPVTLPARVHGKDGAWIYFHADTLPFFVKLTCEDDRNKVISICLSEDRSYISNESPEIKAGKKLTENTYLNHGCRPGQGYFYLLRLRGHKNEIAVMHVGPSLIYCRAKMKLQSHHVPNKIGSISFLTSDQPVQFDEVCHVLALRNLRFDCTPCFFALHSFSRQVRIILDHYPLRSPTGQSRASPKRHPQQQTQQCFFFRWRHFN